ncbi:Hypothetical protein PHPALM_9305 [Phytophthora palmivora]|uniref:HTH CENPB-type domain-containing protein n=1 Tax=Phytophthora palmivora TaxID=4796 RepID=A0A2P4Y7N0_9STRA|nr:Hypothetical protein PHPALM_9305 [Phytophthora palmivora]
MTIAKHRPVGRPYLDGKGCRHTNEARHQNVSVQKKLEVLSFWLPKMRHKIEHFWHDLAPEFDDQAEGYTEGNEIEVELEVVDWVNSLRQEGVPGSPRMLSLLARRVAVDAGVSYFRASDKWIKRFRADIASACGCRRLAHGQINPEH